MVILSFKKNTTKVVKLKKISQDRITSGFQFETTMIHQKKRPLVRVGEWKNCVTVGGFSGAKDEMATTALNHFEHF
jgi:hypothetical protein